MVGNDAFKRAGFVSEVELPGMLDLEEWPTTKLATVSVAHVMLGGSQNSSASIFDPNTIAKTVGWERILAAIC